MKILIDLSEIPACELIHFHNGIIKKLGENHETAIAIREYLSKDKSWTVKYFKGNKEISSIIIR